jgi:hypothetical protein
MMQRQYYAKRFAQRKTGPALSPHGPVLSFKENDP